MGRRPQTHALGAIALSALLFTSAARAQEPSTRPANDSAASVDAAKANDHARAEALSAEGMSAYRTGDHARALERFQGAYTLVPAPELLFNLGQCYRQLKREEAARAVFGAYLKARPNAPERAQIERWMAEHRREHAHPPGPRAAQAATSATKPARAAGSAKRAESGAVGADKPARRAAAQVPTRRVAIAPLPASAATR